MANIGEILVGDFLRIKHSCDFIDHNVYTRDGQGEIDVVGIDNKSRTVYICEVAIHLTTGLQYTKDIEYAEKYFPAYTKKFMLWSPIVKDSKGKIEYNQRDHLERMVAEIKKTKGVEVQLVVNEKFHAAFLD